MTRARRLSRPGLASGIATSLALAAGLALGAGSAAHGDVGTPDSQLHFRMGSVSGSFSGPVSGSFSVANSIDGEFEHFTSSHSSLLIRTLFSYDTSSARLDYAYTGLGRRWYFWSSGMQFESADSGNSVASSAKRRFYFGAEAGISQVLIKTVGSVLQAESADFEFGGNLGIIQQIGKSWGLEGQLGYTTGFGFSSVAEEATTLRILLGVSVFF